LTKKASLLLYSISETYTHDRSIVLKKDLKSNSITCGSLHFIIFFQTDSRAV
jgi:hypothetical protein